MRIPASISKPPHSKINQVPLTDQFARRGSDKTLLHFILGFNGCTKLDKRVRIILILGVRLPNPASVFENGTPLFNDGSHFGANFREVKRRISVVANPQE
jgi:hypothetical protein